MRYYVFITMKCLFEETAPEQGFLQLFGIVTKLQILQSTYVPSVDV